MNKLFFPVVLAGTLFMAVLLQITGKPLKTKSTPLGILNLEFATTDPATRQVVDAWEKHNLIPVAEIHTARDFVFILFYAVLFFSCCRWVGQKMRPASFLQKTGTFLSIAALFAGLMDGLENLGMLVSLTGRISAKITALTFYTSVTKWAIVVLCLVYILLGLFVIVQKKRSG